MIRSEDAREHEMNSRLSGDILEKTRRFLEEANDKIDRLRALEPLLLDVSLRENSVGSPIGPTLAEKLEMLPRLREFGFEHILLGALNYANPDVLEVDDDFMMYLRDHEVDRTGCFAATSIGLVNLEGEFVPDPSLLKLKAYGVPNTILEVYLSQEGMAPLHHSETVWRSLSASIRWLHENISHGREGTKPRILVNIIDGCDAFADNLEVVCSILDRLAKEPIEGVSFQDDRGTFLHFQVGAFVALARRMLPPPLKLLVHIHGGAGFENASVIEALLNGADGAWGALAKCGPVIGHASLGELIANLARVGNPHMRRYRLERLVPLVKELRGSDDSVTRCSMLGDAGQCLPLAFFRQKKGRFMDLPPESVGGETRYHVTPVATDHVAISSRLAEVTGRPAAEFSTRVLDEMIRLMRCDQREGVQLVYDEPTNLLALYARAVG
jgi:hypothetical protein